MFGRDALETNPCFLRNFGSLFPSTPELTFIPLLEPLPSVAIDGYIWHWWLQPAQSGLGGDIATQQSRANLNNAPNLITVVVDVQLKPNLEETKISSQYANTMSQSFSPRKTEQPKNTLSNSAWHKMLLWYGHLSRFMSVTGIPYSSILRNFLPQQILCKGLIDSSE